MQMDVANDEVAQRPGGRIKLFGMERACGGGGLWAGRRSVGEGAGSAAPSPARVMTECRWYRLSSTQSDSMATRGR